MADIIPRSVLITGANAGIGKELARQQLGSRPDIERVVLACRDPGRTESARAELAAATGRGIFEVVILDTSDPAPTRSAARSLGQPVGAVVLNAGGTGRRSPRPRSCASSRTRHSRTTPRRPSTAFPASPSTPEGEHAS